MIFDHQIFGFIFGFDIGELIEYMNLQKFNFKQLSQDQNVSFFLNQQFITRSARADHGSCFVTTLHRKETTGKNGK